MIVKKFGGTSIGSIEQIEKLAAKLVKEKKQGDQLVIVVSAMAKTTDYLFGLAREISDTPYQRELDMLATAGERISMSLLSIALHKHGASAISFTGSQSGIITDNCHGNASIINVNAFRIKEELAKNKIVIVAGYQGVSLEKEVTTLGRGGSDTTAVALAGYLNAKACEIYTDVEGVYSADPNKINGARKLNSIDYDRMLYLARSGCRVIHPRAVEFAMKYDIELEIRSSFVEGLGTKVKKEVTMEEKEIIAITGRNNLSCFDICLKEMKPESLISVFRKNQPDFVEYALRETDIFRVIVEKINEQILHEKLSANNMDDFTLVKNISSLTFTGLRLNSDMQLLETVFKTLSENQTEVFWMTRNNIGFTFYLKTENADALTERFHDLFIDI